MILTHTAHQGALDAGGHTVVVMRCGLGVIYPASNQQLFEKIVAVRHFNFRIFNDHATAWIEFPTTKSFN